MKRISWLAFILYLLCAPVTFAAEHADVGGNWVESSSRDPMTDVEKVRFTLEANHFLRQSSYHKPVIEIFCEGGKYRTAQFAPNVRLGPPNRPGFWGQPQLEVMVRVNDHHDRHGWNWIDDRLLSMDKGTVRGLIGASLFKIEFNGPDGPDIAEFSPAALNLQRVKQACDLTPTH